jgi:hypothetical protein
MNSNNNELFIYNKNIVIDIISCPICLEYYKHPRNLNCGHSFCTTCLHLIKINEEIVCPLCRTITKFNQSFTLIDLSLNTTLISMIDNTTININNNCDNNLDNNLNNKLKCKRSKSLDIISNCKIARKKKILKQHTINNINNEKIISIGICNDKIGACCSFQ